MSPWMRQWTIFFIFRERLESKEMNNISGVDYMKKEIGLKVKVCTDLEFMNQMITSGTVGIIEGTQKGSNGLRDYVKVKVADIQMEIPAEDFENQFSYVTEQKNKNGKG